MHNRNTACQCCEGPYLRGDETTTGPETCEDCRNCCDDACHLVQRGACVADCAACGEPNDVDAYFDSLPVGVTSLGGLS